MQHAMLARRDAAQAALDRFNGVVLRPSWNDCARLAAFTGRKLGYRFPMPRPGSYKTLAEGKRALAAQGFKSLMDPLDQRCERIPYAMALPGDIAAFPTAHEGWVALAVVLGDQRILAFAEDPHGGPEVCRVGSATFAKGFEPLAAWSLQPSVRSLCQR